MRKNINFKIQVIRAIAIIAVVMIHTCPQGMPQVYIRPFINFAVATFLFLSGYLTDLSNINVKQFYKKRIIRVIIPYTIWSILYTTVDFISNGIDLKQYFINYIFAGGAATMYFIFVYIQLVLLTPLLDKLLKTKHWYIPFIISPLSLLINYYWLLNGIIPNEYVLKVWNMCCLGWLIFYYLGLFYKNYNNSHKYILNIIIIIPIYLVAIIFQMMEGYWWLKLDSIDCGSQLKISAVLTSIFFILIIFYYIKSDKYKGNNRLLLLIGNYSFGIYISHYMVIGLLGKIIPFWKSIPFGINTMIVLLVTLLFIILGNKICGERLSKYLGLY